MSHQFNFRKLLDSRVWDLDSSINFSNVFIQMTNRLRLCQIYRRTEESESSVDRQGQRERSDVNVFDNPGMTTYCSSDPMSWRKVPDDDASISSSSQSPRGWYVTYFASYGGGWKRCTRHGPADLGDGRKRWLLIARSRLSKNGKTNRYELVTSSMGHDPVDRPHYWYFIKEWQQHVMRGHSWCQLHFVSREELQCTRHHGDQWCVLLP